MAGLKNEALKDLTSLQERMNKILTDSVKRLKEMTEPEVDKRWSPAVDIVELPEAFVLMAEVPGVDKNDISVEVQGDTLYVRGERPRPDSIAQGKLYRSERSYGAFERTFNLPVNLASGSIQADFNDGVLTITIMKPQEQTRRVKVDIG